MHTGFVSVPTGTFTDAGILSPMIPNSSGGTYLVSSKRWVRAKRELVSPDSTQFVYWKGDSDHAEVRIFNIASGDDKLIYGGTDAFFPVAFTSGGIYLQHVKNLKQGNRENLCSTRPAAHQSW